MATEGREKAEAESDLQMVNKRKSSRPTRSRGLAYGKRDGECVLSSEERTKGELRFEDLSNDCLLAIFKYFPFKERVRFERICSRWEGLLGSVWRQQRVLYCSHDGDEASAAAYPRLSRCRDKSHRIREGDHFQESYATSRQRRPALYGIACYKIVMKCPNLLALYWELPFKNKRMGRLLAENCPLLEHISFHPSNEAGNMLEFLEEVEEVKIKCFHHCLPSIEEETCEKMLKLCPNIRSMIMPQKWVSSEAFQEKVPLLRHLKVTEGTDGPISLNEVQPILDNRGKDLEYLAFATKSGNHRKYTDEAFEAIAQKMPYLKFFYIYLTPVQLVQMKHFNHLEDIVFSPNNYLEVDEDEMKRSLETILRVCGSTLKRINIRRYFPSYAQLVAHFCPNLEIFEAQTYGSLLADIDLSFFGNCLKLRRLTIEGENVTGLDVVFESCPKIREVSFSFIERQRELVQMMKKYANKYPKRSLTFNSCVDFSDTRSSLQLKQLFPKIRGSFLTPKEPKKSFKRKRLMETALIWTSVVEEGQGSGSSEKRLKRGVSGNLRVIVKQEERILTMGRELFKLKRELDKAGMPPILPPSL